MADTRYTVRAAPNMAAARLIPGEEMRDRLIELRIESQGPDDRAAVAFYFLPGHAESVAAKLRVAADQLGAIYSEVRPL
jgi:hypothetical protein